MYKHGCMESNLLPSPLPFHASSWASFTREPDEHKTHLACTEETSLICSPMHQWRSAVLLAHTCTVNTIQSAHFVRSLTASPQGEIISMGRCLQQSYTSKRIWSDIATDTNKEYFAARGRDHSLFLRRWEIALCIFCTAVARNQCAAT